MSDIPIFDDRRNLPEPKPPLEVLHPSPIVENPLLISPIDDIRKFEYEVIGGDISSRSPTEPITPDDYLTDIEKKHIEVFEEPLDRTTVEKTDYKIPFSILLPIGLIIVLIILLALSKKVK